MPKSVDISKEERIKKEVLRIRRILKDLPKEKLNAVSGLIQRAAFMAITLEDLEADINENGTVESFQQGDYEYDRQRPAAQIYNTTVKNYTAACKQLTDLIPVNNQPTTKDKDAFEQILGRGNGG